MSFSYLRERNSEDRGSFDTGSDNAVVESAKLKNAEKNADRETPNEPPLSREEMAEIFGMSPEDLEEFVERTTCFEFDGLEIVAPPL